MAEEEGTALTNEPTPTDTSSNTWREALPEEIREAGALKDIPEQLFFSLVEVADEAGLVSGALELPVDRKILGKVVDV